MHIFLLQLMCMESIQYQVRVDNTMLEAFEVKTGEERGMHCLQCYLI